MKKITLIFIAILFTLTACNSGNSNQITLKQLVSALEKEDLVMDEDDALEEVGFFALEYNRVTPTLYASGSDRLSVYIYDSEEERENGVKLFKLSTEFGHFIYHKIYELENIFIIYLPFNSDNDMVYKTENAIKNALNKLEKK